MSRRSAGFTLLELLVVIAIMAIMAIMAGLRLPALSRPWLSPEAVGPNG